MTAATQTAGYRIQKDLKEVMTSSWVDAPPMVVQPVDDRITHVAALVMGPPDTPYHCGFFTFDLKFPATYPNEPPTVKFLTTCEGYTRLNPNLYADGKVCLSILGTWRGETAEVWRSSYSLLYVLNAIQCLILNGEPYHNEPGFEKEKAERGIVFEQTVAVPVALPAATAAPPGPTPAPAPVSVSPIPAGEGVPGLSASSTPATAAAAPASGENTPHQATLSPPLPEQSTDSPAPVASENAAVALPATTSVPSSAPPPPTVISKVKRLVITAEQIAADKAHYAAKITHEVMRISVCDVLDVLLSISPPPMTASPRGTISPPQTPGLTPTVTQLVGAEGALFPPTSAVLPAPSNPPPHTPSRTAMLATHIGLFAKEIKRQFLARYETYVAQLTPELMDLDGQRFRRLTFEYQGNTCDGFFAFRWLRERLEYIRAALIAETDAWRVRGRDLTTRMAYSASVLKEESERLSEECPGVSGGIVDPSNYFSWEISFIGLEGVYDEAIYNVEVVFTEEAPPRVRFKQPIWHPNISPSGIPLYFLTEPTVAVEKRWSPLWVVQALQKLLNKPPLPSPSSWVNLEAAKQCFSFNAEETKAFKSHARKLARRTNE